MVVYGLVSLRHKHVALRDVQLFCCCWPLLMLFGYFNLLDLEDGTAGGIKQLRDDVSLVLFDPCPAPGLILVPNTP